MNILNDIAPLEDIYFGATSLSLKFKSLKVGLVGPTVQVGVKYNISQIHIFKFLGRIASRKEMDILGNVHHP